MKNYVVVIRAGSRLRFKENERLLIDVDINGKKGFISFQTRYVDEGFRSLVPREIWIDAKGTASSIDEAIASFTNASMFFTNVISFCTNGYAGKCNFHLAFENTPDVKVREFFEQFLEDERGLPHISRVIKPGLVKEVIDVLGKHKERDRLSRGINQYVMALSHWGRGEEIMAQAHLFMGVESIVDLVIKREIERLELDGRPDLAKYYKLDSERDLHSYVRRKIIFRGDLETHSQAKKASDGFEHGFLSYDEIRPHAKKSKDKCAEYLREMIIEVMNLSDETKNELKNGKHKSMLGTEKYIRYFRANLLSDTNKLEQDNFSYPIVEWKFGVNSYENIDGEKLNISFNQQITPMLASGVQMKDMSIEIFGPEGIVVESSKIDDPVITKNIDNKSKIIFTLLDKLYEEVSKIGNNVYLKVNPFDSATFEIFSQCKSIYSSVIMLLKNHHPEEALILSRMLYENQLYLKELSNVENRIPYLLMYQYKGLVAKKKIIQKSRKFSYPGNIEKDTKTIKTRERKLLQYFIKNRVRPRNFEKLENLAKKYCQTEEMWTYYLSEYMSKDKNLFHIFRHDVKSDNVVLINTETKNEGIILNVAIFSTTAISIAIDSFLKIFDLENMSKINELLDQLKEIDR